METIAIKPCGPLDARIRPPGSKSITNRALICAALADGPSTLAGALRSEDTEVMIEALRRLGVRVEQDTAAQTLRVEGCSGRFPGETAELYLANSGTSIRFLTAAVCVGQGVFRLDGSPRMRQRPIGDLLDALTALGAELHSENGNGCPPVIVRAAGLAGGKATVSGAISSQFLSGLLMATPYARASCELVVEGELVSKPYIAMTLAVMRSFGAAVDHSDFSRFRVAAGQRYHGGRFEIEPDASAASYFFAAAAIAGGAVTVEGLTESSLQGDVGFCKCLQQMGCAVQYDQNGITVHGAPLRGVDVDMGDISDTVQTLAAAALFAEGPTTIRGVAHIRHKETDRIGDLARELRKFGAEVDEREDGLRIVPRALSGAEIDTYNDHRMAMSLALVGLRVPGVVIRDPRCTEKTYPDFFADLERLTVQR
ncbi:MAG: 3-phosphoshikimate 1-carboxyvinyltransferase [Planctomycetota bacterium]